MGWLGFFFSSATSADAGVVPVARCVVALHVFFFVLSMVDRRSKTVPSSVESLWCVRAIDAHSGMPIPYVYHLVSLVFSTAFRTCMAVAQRCLHRACFFFSPGA